jgi:tagatose 6-phosphate kinase
VRVVLDAEGPALGSALRAGPYLVKPNVHELAATVGRPLRTQDEIVAAATELLLSGAGAAVISRGAEGLLALTADGHWRAHSTEAVRGNPTGAGDALVAALASGIVRGLPWSESLAEAVAVSAAAVAVPVAGGFDEPTRSRVRAGVVVQMIAGAER